MCVFMAIGIWDIHVGKLRLQALWDLGFGIRGVFVDVPECWARLSGTVLGRKGAGDCGSDGFLIEALEWLNKVPFYASERQTMFSFIRVIRNKWRLT